MDVDIGGETTANLPSIVSKLILSLKHSPAYVVSLVSLMTGDGREVKAMLTSMGPPLITGVKARMKAKARQPGVSREIKRLPLASKVAGVLHGGQGGPSRITDPFPQVRSVGRIVKGHHLY